MPETGETLQERRKMCMEGMKESIRKDIRHAVDGKGRGHL